MVIVEFFSETPIENIISVLTSSPKRIIFVGEAKKIAKQMPILRRFLTAIGNTTTQLEPHGVELHRLNCIVDELEKIVADYPGCHFDLTGGDDLAMVAMGIIYERYRNQGVELHQYNIKTGKIYDCDLNGQVVSKEIPTMTVEQNIILHGGSIVSENLRESGNYGWDFNDDFTEDIHKMWNICKKNCGLWNKQTSMLGMMLSLNCEAENPLGLYVIMSQVRAHMPKSGKSINTKGIFYSLQRAGLIKDFCNEDDSFSLTFKNEQVKRCLTKAGTILELMTCLSAKKIVRKDGTLYYNDVMTGVFIDWDGIVHDEEEEDKKDIKNRRVDTENEIDVVLMHGVVPVFISCKNGEVGEEELYKLNTVAEHFGGRYVKKVLVGTTLGKKEDSKKYFIQRANDMDIRVIDGVDEMSEQAFVKQLKTLV